MSTWNNATKDTSSFANQAYGSASLIWNDATFTWDQETDATWDDPRWPYANQSKSASTFSNQSKN